ncbi:MAG: alpha/beta hydrolase [Verrucomicrobiales bacterium]|nr:alpha/beta hydrolase [Verrucomicrobiales bacterium]
MAYMLSTPTKVNQLSLYENRDREILSYRQFGESENCVILIHGWMTSGIVFDSLLERAELENYRVIVPNLRGSGIDGLDAGPFSVEQFGRDIIDLANHLQLEKFHICGHCMGGQVAQWLASELPTRIISLSLICSVPASGLNFSEELAEAFRNSGGDPETQGLLLEQRSPGLSVAEHERLLAEAGRLNPTAIEKSFDAWTNADFKDQLYRILSPTLVVETTEDHIVSNDIQKKAVAGAIRNAKLVTMDGCGHFPQCENPAAMALHLKSFWAQSTPIKFELPVA